MKRPGVKRRAPPSRGHRPRKRFGQHFLAPAWATRVVAAIAPAPDDVFLEIGPGTGALTLPLAATGAPILAVEIDRDLASDLASRAPGNVTILAADALAVDVLPLLSGLVPHGPPGTPDGAGRRRFRVVGNLPYNVTSPILYRLMAVHEATGLLRDATLMVQREVADRILAKPGSREYGVLTITLAVRARSARLFDLPSGAFLPAPRVQSTLIRIEFTEPTVRLPDEALFHAMVKAIFGRRRKTIANALKAFDRRAPDIIRAAGVNGMRRPETFDVTELARIAELVASARRSPATS